MLNDPTCVRELVPGSEGQRNPLTVVFTAVVLMLMMLGAPVVGSKEKLIVL